MDFNSFIQNKFFEIVTAKTGFKEAATKQTSSWCYVQAHPNASEKVHFDLQQRDDKVFVCFHNEAHGNSYEWKVFQKSASRSKYSNLGWAYDGCIQREVKELDDLEEVTEQLIQEMTPLLEEVYGKGISVLAEEGVNKEVVAHSEEVFPAINGKEPNDSTINEKIDKYDLHPVKITDDDVLRNCKQILNNWSASLPVSPSKVLGDEVECISAFQYYIYKCIITTEFAQRSFSLISEASRGRASRSPKDIESYDLWKIEAENLTSNLEVRLYDTCYERICDTCHGRTLVTCPKCDGSRKETCSFCHGVGYHEYEEEVTCPTCHGKGVVDYGRRACPKCTNRLLKWANYSRSNEGRSVYGGSGVITITKNEKCTRCNGEGKVDCSFCHGDGKVDCTNCNATGKMDYTWTMVQQQMKPSKMQLWQDEQTPVFSAGFCDIEQIAPETVFSISTEKQQVDLSALPQLKCHFSQAIKELVQKTQKVIDATNDIFLHRQKVTLLKYPAAIRYEYRYEGNTYIAWINSTNEKVAEFDNGLTASYSKQLVEKGHTAAKKFNPASAFYYFTKGYTCNSTNHQDALSVAATQLKRVSRCIWWPLGLTFLYCTMNCNDKFNYSYEFVIFFLSLLLAIALGKLFAKGLALKLTGGGLGVILAGVGLGYIASPKNYIDLASSPKEVVKYYAIFVGVVLLLAFILKGWRQIISHWTDFIKNEEDIETKQFMLERLKPSLLPSILLFSLILGGVYYTYRISSHGASAQTKYKAAMNFLSSNDTTKGLKYLKEAANMTYFPAIYQYGVILLEGKYVIKDLSNGVEMIQKAAYGGLPEAQAKLANCLEHGVGIAQNLTEAHLWYEKAAGSEGEAREAADRIAQIAQYWTPAHNGDKEAQYMLGCCYAQGNGIGKNLKTAFKWFLKSADQGFPKAQVHAGGWLVNGNGGVKDVAKGIDYCEKAAEQGFGDAYGILGEFYFYGEVIPKDYDKAFRYFMLSAEKGVPKAMYHVGICYNKGLGTEKDDEKAFAFWQQAAEKNDIASHLALGTCYENGIGTDINYTKALEHYSVAAADSREYAIAAQKRLASIGKVWKLANEENDSWAQCDVGICYFTGDGVKKDYTVALNWFRKSAAQGNPNGLFHVADCLFHGYGTEVNQAEAFQIYAKAAEQEHPRAMFCLGKCYEQGSGIEQNLTTAASWYEKAAEQKFVPAVEALTKVARISKCWDKATRDNDPVAQLELGKCYWEGDGIPKNQRSAFTYFEKSGLQGNREAQYYLGVCYESGQGTEENLTKAIMFYDAAAKQEYIPAIFALAMKYQNGIGVEQNLSTAYELYSQAAAAEYENADKMAEQLHEIAKYWAPAIKEGDARAQYMLSKCYNSGNGVPCDVQKARDFLEKSARQNYADAQFDLAQLLRSEAKNEADDKLVADWLIKASENGHVEAQAQLGELYYTGRGLQKDYGKAVEIWEKAVAKNNAHAMYLLGSYRFTGNGMLNSGKDIDKALALWKSASDLGYVEASFRLAEFYWKGAGMFGAGKDPRLAYEFYEKAAHGGHVEAMYKLGKGLYEGNGIECNVHLGVEWLRKAAELGNEAAKELLERVTKSRHSSGPQKQFYNK